MAKVISRAKRTATTGRVKTGAGKGVKVFRRTSSGGVVKAANRIIKPRQDDVVRARINTDVKVKAEAVLEAAGLDASGAFRMMMQKIAQEGRLPFEPHRPNRETVAAIIEARRGKGKKFTSTKDLMADLDADD